MDAKRCCGYRNDTGGAVLTCTLWRGHLGLHGDGLSEWSDAEGEPPRCTCPPGAHGPVAGCAAHWFGALVAAARAEVATWPAWKSGAPPTQPSEADALRAQLAAAERERDEARRRSSAIHRRAQHAERAVRVALNTGRAAVLTWRARCLRARNKLAASTAGAEIASLRGLLRWRTETVVQIARERDESRALLADALRCGLAEAERLREERGTLLDAHAEERDVWEASRACDLVAERDAALARVATLRGALERAAVTLGGDIGNMLRAALAADDATEKAGRP